MLGQVSFGCDVAPGHPGTPLVGRSSRSSASSLSSGPCGALILETADALGAPATTDHDWAFVEVTHSCNHAFDLELNVSLDASRSQVPLGSVARGVAAVVQVCRIPAQHYVARQFSFDQGAKVLEPGRALGSGTTQRPHGPSAAR